LVWFHVGDRSSKSFENLCENISHIDARFYATDQYSVYDIIPRHKRLVGKAHTYTVERMNRLLRHYLARFARKTYCWSKSFNTIINSIFLFFIVAFFIYSLFAMLTLRHYKIIDRYFSDNAGENTYLYFSNLFFKNLLTKQLLYDNIKTVSIVYLHKLI